MTRSKAFNPLFSVGEHIVLRAVTPVHPGQGRSGGAVDLPVQRDQYGLPMIYASSLKGSLKTLFYYKLKEKLEETQGSGGEDVGVPCPGFRGEAKNRDPVLAITENLMGGKPEGEETSPSMISVLDAYLLAIPVREQENVYVYATSPLILSRYKDLSDAISKISKNSGSGEKTVRPERQSIKLFDCRTSNEGDGGESLVLLDEYKLICRQANGEVYKMLEKVAAFLEEILPDDHFKKPLVLLDDELMVEVAERALERRTRVALNRETKTVSAGPWTEEYIPRGTVFYTALLYKDEDARQCLQAVLGGNDGLDMYILVGGNETIGQGILKLHTTSTSSR